MYSEVNCSIAVVHRLNKKKTKIKMLYNISKVKNRNKLR